jgi:chromosome segregation ATPase
MSASLEAVAQQVNNIEHQIAELAATLKEMRNDKLHEVERIAKIEYEAQANKQAIDRLWQARREDKKRTQAILITVVGGVLTAVSLAIMGLN